LKNRGPVKKLRPVLPSSPGAGVEKRSTSPGEKMKVVFDDWTTPAVPGLQPLQLAGDSTTLLTVNAPE
jgi:hypothetical protein